MKKIIFAIASVCMMAASACFTSCSKGDEEVKDPQKEPVSYTLSFYTLVLSSQLQYINHAFDFTVNGQTQTIALSDMQEVQKKEIDTTFVNKIQVFSKKQDAEIKYYKYDFNLKSGQTLVFNRFNWKCVAEVSSDSDSTIDFLASYYVKASPSIHADLSYGEMHNGVYINRFDAYLKLINKQTFFSIVLK